MAQRYDLRVDAGATFVFRMTWRQPRTPEQIEDGEKGTPYDLSLHTARLKMKSQGGDTLAVIEATTENGKIILGDEAPNIVMTLTATQTDALNDKLRLVYDLELESPEGVVTRLIQGSVILSPQVTR